MRLLTWALYDLANTFFAIGMLWFFKKAKLGNFINILGILGVASGFAIIIGAFLPDMGFFLALDQSVTTTGSLISGQITLLFYSPAADWAGDQVGL